MYRAPDIPGIVWRRELVEYHGPGRGAVAPGRRVVANRRWPYARPEVCRDASNTGQWIAGDRILVCRGCGLDCT